MADFRGMLCWDPPTASATINTEAISPHRSVFLATHAPLRIKRALVSEDKQVQPIGDLINERSVVNDFLTKKSDSGALLMLVLGDSGSGKSHLIRWARENIPTFVPDSDTHEVIYLERSMTSLKAVVKALIAKADSSELAQLKEDVDRFTADIDQESLGRRILNELSELLSATVPKDIPGPGRVLAGPGRLAAMLHDPFIRQHMLSEGKFVPRLAAQLLRDRRSGQDERPETFTFEDLPLDVDYDNAASDMVARLLNQIATRDDLQATAVDLLNKHLESAVKNAANLGAGRLLDAMMQVREEYQRRGKEIILLIEDFALIQGVQQDLLDAVIEAANRDGSTSLAPIRTLMAVTPGYLEQIPETALTRIRATAGYVYNLDVPFSATDTGSQEISSFVGRYLNAARVGRDALERARDGETPNACEGCPLQERCHDAFGVTPEGYGLYPFNSSALVRTVHSTADPKKPWSFVPRTVLGSVVRPLLIDHAESIRRGEFPDSEFRRRFSRADIDKVLSREAHAFIDENDRVEPERRKSLLLFWGDAPADANTIDGTILEAFSLPPLDGQSRRIPTGARPPSTQRHHDESLDRETEPASETDNIPRSLKKKLETVNVWLTDEEVLDNSTALNVRTIIATAVLQRYRWESPLMHEQGKRVMVGVGGAWPNNATVVSVAGADERLAGAADAPIRFGRTAKDSYFFESLLCAESGKGQVRSQDIRRLATYAEQYAPALTSRVQRHLEISDEQLVLGLRASLLGAMLAGQAYPGMEAAALLTAVLDEGQGWERADVALRTKQWNDILKRHLDARPVLVERLREAVGVAQGVTGAVRMIDAARMLPLLKRTTSQWEWTLDRTQVPSWVQKAVTGFSTLSVLVDEQLNLLENQLAEIRQRHPRGTNSAHTLTAIEGALTTAQEVGGLMPLGTDQTLRFESLLERGRQVEWTAVSELEDDLGRASDENRTDRARQAARIAAAAQDRGTAIQDIHFLLSESESWLEAALRRADARTGSTAVDSVSLAMQTVLGEWNEVARLASDASRSAEASATLEGDAE
ncbi:protein DpdH [Streptomyces sp. ATCC 21386]|uniref:protein DpdH n=1 Tax=Streptomyces sp. ATCC 21386 TaxID=2699428 RepID=UPI001BFF105A|nr:protein DpdH [Streptomyces sp. ATCC 21386]